MPPKKPPAPKKPAPKNPQPKQGGGKKGLVKTPPGQPLRAGCVAAPLPATFEKTDLGLPGFKFLESDIAVQAASAKDVAALVSELGGCLDENPKSLADQELLDQAGRTELMRLVDVHSTNENSKTVDLRVSITEDQLIEAIGAEATSRIFKIFDGRPNAIRLRKVEASKGESIAFHTDYSLKTMQIPLNSDTEYDGGRLVWVKNGRFEVPPRRAGSATIHTCGVVHAVTPMTSGVRYGLFLCKLPEDALDVDLTYLIAPTLAQLEFFPQALQLAHAASDAQLADLVGKYHTFMHEGAPEVAPSAEIDLIWRVHRLSPAAYASYRKQIKEGGDRCPSDEWVASLVAAVRRQATFMLKMLEEQSLGRASVDAIRAELENYKAFLGDAGKSEQELPVPSLLLDLVWHTHMMYPARYANECVRIAGRFIDHDDDHDRRSSTAMRLGTSDA